MKNILLPGCLIVVLFSLIVGFLIYKKFNPPRDNVPPRQEEKIKPEKRIPKSYSEALQIARECDTYVFIYYSAKWCKPCEQMRQTLEDPEIKKCLEKYVFYYVDTDKESDLARRSKISSLPTYILATSDRNIINWGIGYKSPQEFLRWLENPNDQ